PEALVAQASSLGLDAIAITDHDTVGGVAAGLAAGEKAGLEVVPGVEIGIAHDPERHLVEIDILGYYIDPEHPELVEALDLLQKAKNGKLAKQLKVLAENDLPIPEEEVLAEAAGDTVRRPHIWKILRKHHPDFRADVFFDKTSFGGEWHVTKDFSLTLEATVELIERAGGVSSMAHPGAYNAVFPKTGELVDPSVDEAVAVCAEAGVRGLEVYYTYDKNRPYYDREPLISKAELAELIEHYRGLCERHGLVPTGGTDFHGTSKPQIAIGEIDVPGDVLDGLRAARRVSR
ncbi:MAG: PHP domain-containing protein, partial [Candidatus Eisenbacteria bacterium]|nr:PHP domain-containing protein [Candidatus Eisenbacteria bacterium]